MKRKISGGVFATGMRWLVAAVMLMGAGVSSALAARPQPQAVTWLTPPSPVNGSFYRYDEEIFIQISFQVDIEVTGFAAGVNPYLALTLYPSDSPANRATYFAHAGNLLILKYKVLAGDFANPLTYPNRFSLALGGAVIYDAAGDPVADAWRPFNEPLPDPAAFAAQNVWVQTVRLNPGSTNVVAGSTTTSAWRVNRGGPRVDTMDVLVASSDPAIASIVEPSQVTIASGASIGSFNITGNSPGTVWITAHPIDYPDGEGVVSNQFTVLANTNQYLVVEPIASAALPPYDEGTTHNWQVRRVGATAGALSVTLTSSGSTIVSVPATVSIPNGQTVIGFSLQARDGDYSATVTATDAGGTYGPGSRVVDVSNVAPTITGGSVSPSSPTVQQTVNASFTADDVTADDPKLVGTWNWGDGTPVSAPVAPGTPASHIYDTPGEYTVTLTVSDTDGGTAIRTFPVTVKPGYTVTVNIRASGYNGLRNVGTGTILFEPAPAVTTWVNANTVRALFPEALGSVLFRAFPNQPDGGGYMNYLYHVRGEGIAVEDQEPLAAGATASEYAVQVPLGQDRTVSVLFSREWRQGDNRGDVDGDGLTDEWEVFWGLNALSSAGANGTGGSLSGDRMPNATNVVFDPLVMDPNGGPYGGPFGYPIVWSPGGWNGYAPVGPLFNNILQFRGQTINFPATLPDVGNTDPDYPNTDPTVADTTGDGLTDGWLYYFWANAVNNTNFVGRAYDPATLTASLDVTNADIVYYFNPRVSRSLAGEDLDNDGLLTIEEYALGTNPIDWDTDGDGLPDGWEVLFELNPLNPFDANENPDNDYMADDGVNIHNDVYLANGFDPRTGWAPNILTDGLTWGDAAPNTRAYRNIDEYRSMIWRMNKTLEDADPANHVTALQPDDWLLYSTNPQTADTDGDGMADGWELYVGLNPSDQLWTGPRYPNDGRLDDDGDGLPNIAEFSCRGAEILYAGVGLFPMQDPGWRNKLWPTDPNDPDTDGDQIADGAEADIFRYDTGDTGYGAGGGLNPTRADTDGDSLPDYWEAYYAGGVATDADGNLVRNGMDGTFSDAFADYDNDGLENFQEYLTGTVYHFQWDKWLPGQGFAGYDPFDFLNPDVYGAVSKYWDGGGEFYFMLAEERPLRGDGLHFATTDPRDWDSDGDGMDDYYEMYHGLNPIWSFHVALPLNGELVGKFPPPPLTRDIRLSPWEVGDEESDPDQDGIPNFEEMLAPNRPSPENHHTDPTPLWITDMSYSESFVNLYYTLGSLPPYWWNDLFPPTYLYSFESNEGYDTDNDNIPDKREIVGTDGSGSTDPLNHLSPAARKALYFDGDAAARTRQGFFHGVDAMRSWTVELWIRPQQVATGARQIIIERPVAYAPGDPLPPTELVRRNFRLGFEADGRLFVEYDNYGSDLLTTRARTAAGFIEDDVWYHIAGVMDGPNKSLSLYINGLLRGRVPTATIPATGVVDGDPLLVRYAPIVLGAADRNPGGWVHGAPRYRNFLIYPPSDQPDLHSFYLGWMDEVRVWNGARSGEQIALDMTKAYKKADVEAVAAVPGGQGLLYHYNFNTLPDPNHETIVPAEFDALNGRPNDGSYPGIPWWYLAADRSTVYNNYLFVHWMQNTVAHLPLEFAFDSKYWSPTSTGGQPAVNSYPNSMNPYGYGYTYSDSSITEANPEFGIHEATLLFQRDIWRLYNDLLPLRGVRADMDVELWDNFGSGTNPDIDSNGDGIPDWWYVRYGYDPDGPSVADLDPDGDGVTNYWEYRLGSDPHNGYSIDPSGVRNDGQWDSDGDGLTNEKEINIFFTDPTRKDTDDDGVSDWEEVTGVEDTTFVRPAHSSPPTTRTDPTDSRDPVVRRSVYFDGNARLIVPSHLKYIAPEWTLEMWVKPEVQQNAVLLSRFVNDPMLGQHGVNYEMGISADSVSAGHVRPYLFYRAIQGAGVRLDGLGATDFLVQNAFEDIEIPVGEWTHLAGVYDATELRMFLYVNGELVAYKPGATEEPALFYVYARPKQGHEVTIGASRSTGAVTGGFRGWIDNVSIQSKALAADELMSPFFLGDTDEEDATLARISTLGRTFAPPAGMHASLTALESTTPVHAMVQFREQPTAADVAALQAQGIEILGEGGARVLAVRATRAALSAAPVASRIHWSGAFLAQDKLSRRLNVTGGQPARKVLVSFFPGVSQAEALQVAANAGASVYGGKFLDQQYMVVTVNDQQLLEMAADDRLSWTAPAADFLTSGGRVRALDHYSLPFEVVGVGWDGPGLGQADLSYFFMNATTDLPRADQERILYEAMLKWSEHAALTWREATRQGLNESIDVGYYSGDHGDGYPFDGPGGVLAHAFFPNDINPEPIAGDLHFDDDETWSESGSGNTFSLPYVALHELGHSLGLGHSDNPEAVMYPFYRSTSDPQLHQDDIDGIQSLYGPPVAAFLPSRVAYFYFNDGGETAEDFTQGKDWLRNWEYAAVLDGAVFDIADWTWGKDSDGDTLPDWWEELYRLNPLDPNGMHGRDGDPDGDGLINYYEYLMGTNPRIADTDGDGVSDYDEDPDGDGLSTRAEIEIYQTNPADADTDDDGIPDGVELAQGSDPRDSLSPYVARALRFDGGRAVVAYDANLPDNDRFDLDTWTIEMIVQPDVTNTTAVLLAKAVGHVGAVNYEVGLTNGLPYVRYDSAGGGQAVLLVAGALHRAGPDGRTHIAARSTGATTTANGRLDLFVNGVIVRGQDILLRGITGPGALTLGSPAYRGTMREVRIWNIARTNADIAAFSDRTLFFGSEVSNAAFLRVGGTGLLKESATTQSGGGFIDELTDQWTLEAWVRTTGSGTVIARRNTGNTTTEWFNYYLGVADNGGLLGRFMIFYTVMTLTDNEDGTQTPDFTTYFNTTINNLQGEIRVDDGQWHHVAYVRDADSTRLYVDGQLDSRQERLLVPLVEDGVIVAAGVYAIAGPVVMGENMVGDLDEIRIWRRGLPQAELVDIGGRNLAGSEVDLISYFGFDFQRGKVADERSVLRDPETEYGIYIGDAQRVVSSTDLPPIRLNPLLVYRGIALAGYFAAVDGGRTVEDFVNKMGSWPFNQEAYAAVMTGAVTFETVLDDFDDSDGDGMPDWWESMHGMDPGSALGNDGPYADPDGDGMSNLAEYLAGTDPNNPDSAGDGFSDYDSRASVYALTWGELYTDGDNIPDAWEALYDRIAPATGKAGPNVSRFDAYDDPDEDGWSNLAEYLGQYVKMTQVVDANGNMTETEALVASPSPLDQTQYPMPQVMVRLRYSGELGTSIDKAIGAARPAYVHFYRTPERDGHTAGELTMQTGTVTTRQLTEGHLVEGTNYVFAFLDTNNNGLWDSDWTNNYSEPAGIAAVDIGWADGSEIEIELTHEPKGFWRFGWDPKPGALGYTVVLRRDAGVEILTRTITGGDRTYFHEGDYLNGNLFGMRAELHSALIYAKQDFYGVEPDLYHTVVFRKNTNAVSTASVPVIVSPQGALPNVYASNEFEWTMDPYAVRYRTEIAATNSSGGVGTTLMARTRIRPTLDVTGRYRDVLPFYAGDTGNVGQTWKNGTYWIRVRGLSDSGNTQFSAWKSFTLNVQPPESGGKSAVEGDLFYFGRVQHGNKQNPRYLAGETNMTIIVQSYRNAAFAGRPDAQVQINAPRGGIGGDAFKGAYTLLGLHAGTHYVRAFIDLNGNRVLDRFEPWGVKRSGLLSTGYAPEAINLTSATGTRARNKRIVIRDHDTDNDGLADGWEYSYMGTLDYGAGDDPDGDGLTMLQEYLAAGIFDPSSPYSFGAGLHDSVMINYAGEDPLRDSDGDGMSDLDEVLYAKTDPDDVNDVLRLLAQQSVMPLSGDPAVAAPARFTWQGKAGVRYVVRSSGDLKTWTDRKTFDGAGTHAFEETDPARTRQFYVVEIR